MKYKAANKAPKARLSDFTFQTTNPIFQVLSSAGLNFEGKPFLQALAGQAGFTEITDRAFARQIASKWSGMEN